MANNHRQSWMERTEASRDQMKGIDVLPDDALLEVFDFYLDMSLQYKFKATIEAWQLLVHVCRRWKNLVLESPRRLRLRLVCTPRTPARDTLDVWPPLPLIISGSMSSLSGTENVMAALKQSNRICQIALLDFARWQLDKVLAAMQVPFPELTDLRFSSDDKPVPAIRDSDSFLNGSAPRLQRFSLKGIACPGLPKLLSSANHLVSLSLINIPHSGYISPKAMATLLSVLSSLGRLVLAFQCPRSHADRDIRSLPPPERFILPALLSFNFKGDIEYLEDLVTFIDAPQLVNMNISFCNEFDFDTRQLPRFIKRALEIHDAHVTFFDGSAIVRLVARSGTLEIRIPCRVLGPDWHLSSVKQFCNSFFPPLSTVEDLFIEHRYSRRIWKHDAIDNILWLQLFLPFTALKNLYLSKEIAPGVAAALQEPVRARMTEVLPSLRNIFVEGLKRSGHFQESIAQFVAVRQLSNHPIAISVWHKTPG